ncbi:hypothetical protein ACFL6R_07305 [Gemmatimonadota bacterium]
MDSYRRHPVRTLRPWILCVLTAVAACSRSEHTFVEVTEAGIPVARTTGGPLLTEPPFRLEREMVFGDPEQGESAMLTSPRGYMEVPGGLAVLDGGSRSLKVYNNDGSLRFSLGRRGQGPGEFEDPDMDHSLAPDGRVLITDGTNQRLTLVDPATGEFEIITMRDKHSFNAAQIATDRYLIHDPTLTPDFAQLESLLLVDRSFTVVDTFAAIPAGRVFRVSRGPGDDTPGIQVSQPFWPFFSWWVQADRIAISQGKEFRVDLHASDGTLVRRVEWDAPLTAVDDSMWQAAYERTREQYRDNAPTVWSIFERPEHVPSMETVRLDDLGRIWALRYIPSQRWGGPEDQTLYWDVVTPDGEWLGTQPFTGITRYFGNDVCYMTESGEESSVVVRYRLVPAER